MINKKTKNKSDLKRYFSKKISFLLVCVFILSSVVLTSCSGEGDDVVVSFGEKSLSLSEYKCYLLKNKENVVATYRAYYESDPEFFKEFFGFAPDGSSDYWETSFMNEFLKEENQTVKEYIVETTLKACKEYVVYEKIAKDYRYPGLPESITKQFDALRESDINKYGSFEAWNIATIGKYGITAEQLMDISYVSTYGTVLPAFIFGEKGANISDEKALESLKDSVQFKYSVYYYQTDVEEPQENTQNNNSSESESGEEKTESEDTSEDTSEDKESFTTEEFNKYLKDRMHKNYEDVLSGKKSFDEVWKDSDEYEATKDKLPNGFILTIKDFNTYFSLDKEKYNVGEIFVAETAAGIFMIKVVDITSDYINAKKANLIDDCFEEILLDYFKDVKVNQTLIDSIKV